jgi:hypothetical protein
MIKSHFLPGLALVLAAPLAAQQTPPFRIAGSGQAFWRLDEAVKAVGDREATILFASGTFHDCAAQHAGRITFKAIEPGRAVLDGQTCEGKAALVLHGRGARVEGIVFQNMRVPDGNGAGIRLEAGNLEVINSLFRNSEEGILTADDTRGAIMIDHSTFSGLGRCDRGLSCAHSVYIGNYGSVTVQHSRFERGMGGHYFKSRAAHNIVTANSFDDSHGHVTNYMVDLCAGSSGTVTGNVFVQGRDKDNHSALITVAAEERLHRSGGLAISNNTASQAPGADWPTVFVADWSHEPLRLGANKLSGRIKPFETR